MLHLKLEGDRYTYLPGEEVRGVVGWDLPEPPKDAQLKLFWYTLGIGTQDIGVVEGFEVTGGAEHREAFVFALPLSPYSFSGIHITLQWAVELIVNKGKESIHHDITVSPFPEPILLRQAGKK